MAKESSIPRQPLSQDDPPLKSDEPEVLRTQLKELQIEVDVLKETYWNIKKDPGADLTEFESREKEMIIGALEKKHTLPTWLSVPPSGTEAGRGCVSEKVVQQIMKNKKSGGFRNKAEKVSSWLGRNISRGRKCHLSKFP